MKELTGTWKGWYEYLEGYDLPYFGQRVFLTMELTFENGLMQGTMQEEASEFSVPFPSQISGFIENDFVSFINRYEKNPNINDEGEMEVLEGPHEVEYSGFMELEHRSMYGKWIIEKVMVEEGYEQIARCEGAWLMKKVD